MRVFFCLFLALFYSCSDKDSDLRESCIPVLFDADKYNSSQNFGIDLIDYRLDELCLKVELGVSGCDDAHVIQLISNGAVAPSDPTVVYFDFYDENPQSCKAYFTIEKEYDMTPIKEKYAEDIIVLFRSNEGSIKIDN